MTFIVRNPTGTYPENYIKIFDFGDDFTVGEKVPQILEVRNDGDTAITLADPFLALSEGTHFEITQPAGQTLGPGEAVSFTIKFTPQNLGKLTDTMQVSLHNR